LGCTGDWPAHKPGILPWPACSKGPLLSVMHTLPLMQGQPGPAPISLLQYTLLCSAWCSALHFCGSWCSALCFCGPRCGALYFCGLWCSARRLQPVHSPCIQRLHSFGAAAARRACTCKLTIACRGTCCAASVADR